MRPRESGVSESGGDLCFGLCPPVCTLGFRALLPALPMMGDGEVQGAGHVVIPPLCFTGTQSERSQGLQGQPHVRHYGRYSGEQAG